MTPPNPDSPGGPLDRAFDEQQPYPEPAELLQYFLDQFQQRVLGLEHAWSERDLQMVRKLTEELRGDAVACDFVEVCGEAWELEGDLSQDVEMSAVSEKIEDLITLCRQTNSRRSRGM